jgi:hypothetical protein
MNTKRITKYFRNKSQTNFLTSIPLIIFFLLLSNCTPARIASDDFSKNTKTSKAIITRESGVIFFAVPAIFGYDEKDKVKLWNGDKSAIDVPVGKHEFFVRSDQADRPSRLSVEVKEGKTLCFVINPDSEPVLKFVIIPLYWFSHAFKIEEREGSCQ